MDDGKDELFLADIAAYLDIHEPLQALWGVDSASLFDNLAHCSALQSSTAAASEQTALITNATALISSPSPSSSSSDAIRATSSSSSDRRQQQRSANKCVRNVTRERRKRELQELRSQCVELEQQLRGLQQQQKQNQQQQQNQTPMQQTLLLATWKRIAERQLVLRTQAEQENWRLKQKTQQQQLIATNLQQSLCHWSAMIREEEPVKTPPVAATIPRPTHVAMNVSSVVDAGDVEIYRQLLSEVDADHLRMDAVLRENGLIHWQVATKTSTMHMKSRRPADQSSSLYIELMEADVIPFEVEMVFKVIWRCWHRRKIPQGSVVYERTAHTYSEDDSTTILSKMRFDMAANGESVVMDTLCVVRAYIEHDRISYVLRGITKADGHFPGVYIEETDWCLMKPLQDGAAATAIFSCAHMETKQFNVGSCGDVVELEASPLATLCASAYEVDMDEVSNMMLNILLQDNSSSSASSYSTSETAAYVRHLA